MIGYNPNESLQQLEREAVFRQQLIISAIAGCAKRHDAETSIKDTPEEMAQYAIKVADEVIKLLQREEALKSESFG